MQQTWRNDATNCYTSLHYATQRNILGNADYKLDKSTRFSFGYNGDTVRLKTVII